MSHDVEFIAKVIDEVEDEYQARGGRYDVYLKGIFRVICFYCVCRLMPEDAVKGKAAMKKKV